VVVNLGRAQSEAVTLSASSTIFMTSLHGGENAKREVAFGPAADVVIPAGALQVTVPVVSRMAGRVANVQPGALTLLHGAPAGATFTQSGAMTGGEDPALWFVFLAGIVAISAMVLPGISGSFILLMLGLYHFMTFTLRSLVYDRDMEALGVTVVFVCALVIGITGFSRVLRMLLERFHDVTMAALVGLMIGSLRKIWPFVATSLDGGVQTNVLPTTLDAQVILTLVTCTLGVVAVMALERAGRKALQAD
jgi:putative membrane protein